jgi:hypothetical protein
MTSLLATIETSGIRNYSHGETTALVSPTAKLECFWSTECVPPDRT